MQSQRKPAAPRKARRPQAVASRPEYTAAVRFTNGSRDIFRILNADDMDDARAMVLAELDDVSSLVIALRN